MSWGTYGIHRRRGETDWFFRYGVTAPNGSILAVTATRRGARLEIRRDIRRKSKDALGLSWWDTPAIEEYSPHEVRP